jgi:abortive infection bacteriophage resistance protein
LNVIRNIVAHHGRLWNRFLGVAPTLPRPATMPDFDVLLAQRSINKRLYFVLCVLAHFLSIISPTSSWKKRVVALADALPPMPHAKLSDAGFPADWKTHAFWN